MNAKVLSTADGSELRTIDLADAVFGREVSEGAIYNAVNAELANRRVGTAAVKTRSEVVGSGKKPWRQKGTGRARAGSRQSPIWVGGGVAFGPQPRSYRSRLPRKQKRVAMKSLLSMIVGDERLVVVEDFEVDSGKTRDMNAVMQRLVPQERTVLVLADDAALTRRAARNIPWLRVLSYNRLSAHELFYAHHVVMTESAVQSLNEFYGE
ncbi:MAG: 50S ribosomal protein L4 [Spirochaetaceae bacterium]